MVPPARPAKDDPRARKATQADILPNQGDFGLSVRIGDLIAPAGVYAGDRDMFVFLVNPDRIIDDGGKGLMRGVFVWNSEVGAGAFKVRTFLMENCCSNHICWNTSAVKDLRIIHRKGSIGAFGHKMTVQLRDYTEMSTSSEQNMVKAARQYEIAPDQEAVVNRLYDIKSLALTRDDLANGWDYAVKYEDAARSAPTTAWGFVHGLTRYSQQSPYADARAPVRCGCWRYLGDGGLVCQNARFSANNSRLRYSPITRR